MMIANHSLKTSEQGLENSVHITLVLPSLPSLVFTSLPTVGASIQSFSFFWLLCNYYMSSAT